MNIKKAKEEIKYAIQAYLAKDEFGEYRIPAVRQRPVLLMGAPGIGKTAVMEQVARECGVALVSTALRIIRVSLPSGCPLSARRNTAERNTP